MFPSEPDFFGRRQHLRDSEGMDSPLSANPPDRDGLPPSVAERATWTGGEWRERLWLGANVVAWLIGLIFALPSAMADGIGPIGAAVWSAEFTLFFVTLPSRVALNLMVRERRRRHLKETILCCVTFGILCWVAYTIIHYPNAIP